jgi:hypothetical protein
MKLAVQATQLEIILKLRIADRRDADLESARHVTTRLWVSRQGCVDGDSRRELYNSRWNDTAMLKCLVDLIIAIISTRQ